MKDELDALEVRDLSLLFAREVLGISDARVGERWEMTDDPTEPNVLVGTSGLGKCRLPDFAEDSGEIMPFVTRHHFDARNNAGGGVQIDLYQMTPEHKIYGSSHTPFLSFARAATIAMIRAHRAGVRIVYPLSKP
jgi:hypothetical protein